LPAKKTLDIGEVLVRQASTPPGIGSEFIGFRPSWINVGNRGDFLQTESMGHGEHKLPDKFTGMIADNAYTQNSVCTRHGQHFDEPVRFTVSQCPVMMIELIAGQLIANIALLRFLLT